jgi:hypothetical protein
MDQELFNLHFYERLAVCSFYIDYPINCRAKIYYFYTRNVIFFCSIEGRNNQLLVSISIEKMLLRWNSWTSL